MVKCHVFFISYVPKLIFKTRYQALLLILYEWQLIKHKSNNDKGERLTVTLYWKNSSDIYGKKTKL